MTADAVPSPPESPVPVGEIVRLSDPTRRPTDWASTLRGGRVAALLTDARTGGPVAPDGSPWPAGVPAVCYAFRTVDEAAAFGAATVGAAATVRCDVYDERGKAVPPLRTFVPPSHVDRGRRTRRWQSAAAVAFLAGSVPLFWWDYTRHGDLFLPTLFGINCVFMAIRFAYLAVSAGEGARF